MDFLIGTGDPWRIVVNSTDDLVAPTAVLSAESEITLRLITPYSDETDMVVQTNTTMSRLRVARAVRKHLRAVGRNQMKVDGTTHRDCFLMEVTAHDTESNVFNVVIQRAEELDLLPWSVIRKQPQQT